MVAEISCLMCSRTVGTVVATRWLPVGVVLIQPAGSNRLQRCLVDRLRCPDCNGNTAPTEVTQQSIRRERVIDWQTGDQRRGRPPKWLVAQRAAARRLFDQVTA
jgi:hypothetical protein